MAGGWSKDGVVHDQIDASVDDAIGNKFVPFFTIFN